MYITMKLFEPRIKPITSSKASGCSTYHTTGAGLLIIKFKCISCNYSFFSGTRVVQGREASPIPQGAANIPQDKLAKYAGKSNMVRFGLCTFSVLSRPMLFYVFSHVFLLFLAPAVGFNPVRTYL